MGRRYYEVRVAGTLGPAAREAFADLALAVEPMSTVLVGQLAPADLPLLLDQVRALGLEVIEVTQTTVPPRGGEVPTGERPT